ncbi:MAG TPA: hypothetical protein VII70_02770 [Steroidobacteraceae bacterium]
MRHVSRAASAFALALILAAAAQVASADVTVQQRISIEGIGGMSIANMSGATTTTIAGDKSRTESDLQMQSKLLRMFARGATGPHVDIVRLNEDTLDHLDVNKKEYTETTFAQMRAQMQKAMDQAGSQPTREDPKPGNVDDSKCEWSDPKAEVKRSGEHATFAGYDAERMTITASQACKDKDTGSVCEFVLSLDEWLAPKFERSAEALSYERAYAQKLGLGTATTSKDLSERAQAMFGRYKGIWSEVAAKTKDIKGYPVRTSFALAVGGPQCKGDNNQSADASASSSNSSANAASSSTDSTPTTPAAMASQLGGKLAGMFHKKSDTPPPADANASAPATAPPPAALPAGMIPLMTMSSELVSVSTTAVDPGVFQVPAGFKKVER